MPHGDRAPWLQAGTHRRLPAVAEGVRISLEGAAPSAPKYLGHDGACPSRSPCTQHRRNIFFLTQALGILSGAVL